MESRADMGLGWRIRLVRSAKRYSPVVFWTCAMVLLGLSWRCTDAGLLPVVSEPPLTASQDRIEIRGEVCSDPAQDVLFPVKILFVIDTSGSMQQTDPNNRRATAVEDVLARYRHNPGVWIAIVSFRESVNDLTGGFTQDPERLNAAIEGLRLADSLTDYQGALGLSYTIVQRDILAASPAERARTKYVMVFLSDGTPQPLCSRARACVTDEECGNTFSACEQGNCTDPFLVCEVDREAWSSIQVPDSLYPELEAGTDYNQPYQVVQWIDELRALAQRYAVGDLRFHAGFLYDPNTSPAWQQAFGLDPVAGAALLRDMALHGGGRYMNFASGDEIDFLQVDYTAIRRDFVLRSLFASNTSVLPRSGYAALDSDGDGLADEEEFQLDSLALSADSDGDGYSDWLEWLRAESGFDPNDAARPTTACAADLRHDRDGDGLNDCEEAVLGTDAMLFDSDRDGLPDGNEAHNRTDPLVADEQSDLDGDGLTNGPESRTHSDPFRADATWARTEAYQARIEPLPVEGAGQHCYAFSFANIRVDQTQAGMYDDRPGLNLIRVRFIEALEDDARDPGQMVEACALARWVKPYYLDPVSGLLTLERDDFKPAGQLQLPDDCSGIEPQPPAELFPDTQGGAP